MTLSKGNSNGPASGSVNSSVNGSSHDMQATPFDNGDEQHPTQGHSLTVLAQASAEEVKLFTEELLPQLAPVEVIQNRTGLAMLPATDSAQGGVFHLGEVLLAEAHVRIGEQEGYAACLGRDLVQALALAILDAVLQDVEANPAIKPQVIAFVTRMAARQQLEEQELLRKVETTRVELEVF